MKQMERIANIENNNAWFRNNVFFLFSKGCIFSKDDEKMMSEILRLFVPSESKFLDNKIIISDYHDNDIKAIEKKLLIDNGNYHICLIIGVYLDADLERAPEKMLAAHGLVNYFLSWSEVKDAITNYIADYGFRLKEIPKPKELLNIKISKESLNEIEKETALRNDFDKINIRKKKNPLQRAGIYERIRNAKIGIVAPNVEFEPLKRDFMPKEVPNAVQFYDDDSAFAVDGRTEHIIISAK